MVPAFCIYCMQAVVACATCCAHVHVCACMSVTGFASDQCPEGFVAVSKGSLRILAVENVGETFNQQVRSHIHTLLQSEYGCMAKSMRVAGLADVSVLIWLRARACMLTARPPLRSIDSTSKLYVCSMLVTHALVCCVLSSMYTGHEIAVHATSIMHPPRREPAGSGRGGSRSHPPSRER